MKTADGVTAELRPCPAWCTGEHFGEGDPVWLQDGFWHYGPETDIPTSDRAHQAGQPSVVTVSARAWAPHLRADPDQGLVGLRVSADDGEALVNITPAEARAAAAALLMAAGAAEHDGPPGQRNAPPA
jgi:hypothetical protein